MMNSMIKENGVTFKELEKNIYAWVCQIGREFTKEFLVQKFLNKWTIFLFCSILFSSNQKEH